MTFAPIIPASGVVGPRLLSQTQDAQRAVFDRQPQLAREVEYFAEKIADVRTAEDLVADRRLLRVALGAFGLDDEIDKGAFLRKILAEGTEDPEAFANKLVDPRFVKFAKAFGFGDFLGARTGDVGFAANITAAYKERQFERAVGDQDTALRLALNFRREIATYANANDPENSAWFSAMGDVPVRSVFEGAFGLSSAFGQLDIDRQRDELKDLNNRFFGSKSLAVFQDSAEVENLINRFLVQRTIQDGPSPTTKGAAALILLSNAANGVGSIGIQNIILSSR